LGRVRQKTGVGCYSCDGAVVHNVTTAKPGRRDQYGFI
jgi:hypothetical protein